MTCAWEKIPNPFMIAAVRRYIEERQPVGGFLTAIVTNNLRETFACADDINGSLVREWVHWFYNEAPGACWGSEAKMAAWLAGEPR